MATRSVDAIFQVTQVTIVTSGDPVSDIAVHGATRRGTPHQMLAVTVGDLLVYCYDFLAVAGFAAAWERATVTLPVHLPRVVEESAANVHGAAVILRVDGEPDVRVLGFGADTNPTGRAHVSVRVGPLLVLAFDHTSVQAWHTTWQQALAMAATLWPKESRNTETHIRQYRRQVLKGNRPLQDRTT